VTGTALYISYDGVMEPLGESQVLGYVERLALTYRIVLLTFEKPADLRDTARRAELQRRLESRGIAWNCLTYTKHPPIVSTGLDVIRGVWRGHDIAGGCGLIHARGYVAALIALVLARVTNAVFLFDMRGFWADEKVDGGHWTRTSLVYRVTKYFERRFFESAQAIVSLTHAGVRELPTLGYNIQPTTPIDVIPTCTDLQRFSPGPRDSRLVDELGLAGHLVIGASGTMSNWYLRKEMLEAMAYLQRALAPAKLLLVTREDPERLRADAIEAGVAPEAIVITAVSYERMPDYLRLMDLGLFFIRVCFSKKGSCATKLGEFLATGVPVVINDGVGDSGDLVRRYGAGVVLEQPTVAALESQLPAVRTLLTDPAAAERCRAAARAHFDVNEGSRKYADLYRHLLRTLPGPVEAQLT
jgi:glycosyltransferase involved in cell wall biosynthesis